MILFIPLTKSSWQMVSLFPSICSAFTYLSQTYNMEVLNNKSTKIIKFPLNGEQGSGGHADDVYLMTWTKMWKPRSNLFKLCGWLSSCIPSHQTYTSLQYLGQGYSAKSQLSKSVIFHISVSSSLIQIPYFNQFYQFCGLCNSWCASE